MATPSIELVASLREAAKRLQSGARYYWGHHGACNCGQLLQVITTLSEGEILRHAHTGNGEWTELAEEYCHISGTPVGLLIATLEKAGLTPADIRHLEYLTDRHVLEQLPGGFRWLKRNVREDVVVYFETFADMLEDRMASAISIPPEVFNGRVLLES